MYYVRRSGVSGATESGGTERCTGSRVAGRQRSAMSGHLNLRGLNPVPVHPRKSTHPPNQTPNREQQVDRNDPHAGPPLHACRRGLRVPTLGPNRHRLRQRRRAGRRSRPRAAGMGGTSRPGRRARPGDSEQRGRRRHRALRYSGCGSAAAWPRRSGQRKRKRHPGVRRRRRAHRHVGRDGGRAGGVSEPRVAGLPAPGFPRGG